MMDTRYDWDAMIFENSSTVIRLTLLNALGMAPSVNQSLQSVQHPDNNEPKNVNSAYEPRGSSGRSL